MKKDLPGKFSTLSPRQSEYHLYGHSLFLWDPDTNTAYIYVHIPKNASSFMKSVFKHAFRFNYLTNTFLEELPSDAPDMLTMLTGGRKYIVVLREPVDRWITGLSQYINPQQNYSNLDFAEFVEDPIKFNSHTEPQISFVDQLETDKIIWFNVQPRIFKNVFTWALNNDMRHLLHVPDIRADVENSFNFTNKKSKTWRNFVNDLSAFLQENPNCYDKIVDAYSQDIDLYDSVNFFNYQDYENVHGPR